MRRRVSLSLSEITLLRDASTIALSAHSYDSLENWGEALLAAVAQLMGAHKAALRFELTENRVAAVSHGFDLAPVAHDYANYFHRFDFGRIIGDVEPRHVWSSADMQLTPRFKRLYLRSEYYTDYQRPHGLCNGVALSTLAKETSTTGVLYLWHDSLRHRHFGERGKVILSLLLPAFVAGMPVPERDQVVAAGAAAIDALRDGVALFAADGRLLHQNPTLSRMLGDPRGASDLQAAVSATVQGLLALRRSGTDGLGIVGLPGARTVGTAHGTMRVTGSYLDRHILGGAPRIIVTVCPSNSGEAVMGLRSPPAPSGVELSPREEEVARLLARRFTNAEVAQALGISEHTARHHTERVLRKLGVRSRRELDNRGGRDRA